MVPGTQADVRRSIVAGLAAPAEARDAVSALPVDVSTRKRLALVVSELVTNSLRHAGLAAGDPIELQVRRDNGYIRVAVHDDGPGFSPSVPAAEPGANGGFGLAIIARLAREWGVEYGPDGCTVWCAVEHA